jgi:hypothetical protein
VFPSFVPRAFEMQDGSSEKFVWLEMKITTEEFEAALDLCNNIAPGEDGIRIGMYSCSTFSTNFFRMVMFRRAGRGQRNKSAFC